MKTVRDLREAIAALSDDLPLAVFNEDDQAWVDVDAVDVRNVIRDCYARVPMLHEPGVAEYDANATPALCIG